MNAFTFAEVSASGERKMHGLSENSLPAGEAGGLWEHLPQKMLRLYSLQHKAGVGFHLFYFCPLKAM